MLRSEKENGPAAVQTLGALTSSCEEPMPGEYHRRLTREEHEDIKRRSAAGETGRSIARAVGVSARTISLVLNGRVPPKATLSDRFFARVNKNGPPPAHLPHLGPCHVWEGYIRQDGYGEIGLGAKAEGTALTHHVGFFLEYGRWPEPCGLHKCDVRACVRPDHLFEGDRAINNADAAAKGRTFQGEARSALQRITSPRGSTHWRSKLSEEDVRSIRRRAADGESNKAIAASFGMSIGTIGGIVRGEHWRHVKEE